MRIHIAVAPCRTRMNPKRILVVKLSSLGDLFHALPAVHTLKVRLDAEIDWATQREYADLVRRFTDVSRVIVFPRRRIDGAWWTFLRDLRRFRYDTIVDLQGLLKSAIVARLARGPRRIGPSYHREGAQFFYTAVTAVRNPDRHAVEQALDIVDHLDLEPLPPVFPVTFPPRPLQQGAPPRVALFPASRWPSKCWPEDLAIAAGRILTRQHGVSLFLLGSKPDAPVCRRIEREIGPGVVNLAGTLSLVELGSTLAGMGLVVSNDSGPMHMAAAIGTPVLALFGPTDPRRTGPWGEGHRVLTGTFSCRPCRRRTCRFGSPACMHEITPLRVVEAAVEMLGKKPAAG